MPASCNHPESYRCGIIGTGRIASLMEKDPLRGSPCTHAGFYANHPQCEIISGCDIDPKQLKTFGNDWNLSNDQLYSDYQNMLENESFDLVSVCAYAPERVAMCEAALQAGVKGLWIEKALGCSLADANRIASLVQKYNAQAVVDYPRRARAPFRVIKKLIEEQTYGNLQSVTCHMTHQLLHTGTHAYDVLRYWCGEPIRISGQLENDINGKEISDQGGIATIEMSSGTTAFISAKRKKYYIFQFDLIFDNARILIGNDIQKVFLPDTSKNYTGFKELFETNEFNWVDSHNENLLNDLIESVQQEKPPLCSVKNAIEALRIGLGIFHSHQTGGNWIRPDSIPTDLYVPSV